MFHPFIPYAANRLRHTICRATHKFLCNFLGTALLVPEVSQSTPAGGSEELSNREHALRLSVVFESRNGIARRRDANRADRAETEKHRRGLRPRGRAALRHRQDYSEVRCLYYAT